MANISFGTWQAVMQQTPMIIRRVKTACNLFLSGLLVYKPQYADAVGIALLAVNSIGILFGVAPDENKNTSVNN